MRVLLDENLPRDLAGELPDHQVVTVVGLGWSGVSNGELLRRATGRVDAFVTMDRNLEHQQRLGERDFGIVIIRAPSNRMLHLRPLVPALTAALAVLKPGIVVHIGPEVVDP